MFICWSCVGQSLGVVFLWFDVQDSKCIERLRLHNGGCDVFLDSEFQHKQTHSPCIRDDAEVIPAQLVQDDRGKSPSQ